MKVRASKSSDPIGSTAVIFETISQLDFLDLTSQERDYLNTSINAQKFKIFRLNRFPNYIHLVKVDTTDLQGAAYHEKLRVLGNKLLRMTGAEKAKELKVVSCTDEKDAYFLTEGVALGAYQFLKYYSDKKEREHSLKTISVFGLKAKDIKELNAIVKAVYQARDLVNEPLNYLTATQLAKEAEKAGKNSGFSVEVFNKKKIESLKMGGILAVNRGSIDPPTFSVLTYNPKGAKNKKPVVLVGKGVVYDTGGLSLKPTPNSMDSMKSDMGGSAAVIGSMVAIAESGLPLNVIGLVPATDNRPGQNAYVPGDVIKMYDGSTVEVLNTDAEGRMLLADALAYAKKLDPELVIDLATLTGAAAVAVGKYASVAMGTAEQETMDQLVASGQEVYERIAPFPFWDDYNELLKSTIADVKNIGGREAGAITAGKFLERFTDYPWIHIDIAGPAFLNAAHDYRTVGGSGVGVRLLFNFLKSMVDGK